MNHKSIVLGLLAGAWLAAALYPQPAHAINTYTVKSLDAQVAVRLNSGGDTVGYAVINGFPRAFVHTAEDGTVILPVPAGDQITKANDVSDRGTGGLIEIVGSAYPSILDEPGTAHRWTFQPGVGVVDSESLGVIGADRFSTANANNARGEITGVSDPRNLTGTRVFLFTPATGMVDLGFRAVAEDINELGQIAGYSGPNAWRTNLAGVKENLGVPAGAIISWAFAINDAGSVAGSAVLPAGGQERVVRFSDAAGWEILGGIGTTNIGWGINNNGDVVGEGTVGTLGVRGVIYTDELGRLAYVDDFLDDSAAGWTILQAYDVNNGGQIAGYGVNSTTGQGGAVLLTPTGPQQSVPAAPSALTGSAFANGIQLTWSDNSNNERGFKIERKGPADADFAQIIITSAPSYHDANVDNCASYEYRVRAFNDSGNSAYSNTAVVDAPCIQPPAAPSDLVAGLSLGNVMLDWTDNSDNESGFEVERDSGQGFQLIATTRASGYTDINVTLCMNYSYRVRAVNVAGVSAYSNVAVAQTDCPPSVDTEPPQVTINAPTDGEAISWRNVEILASATDNIGVRRMTAFVGDDRVCRTRNKSEMDCTWRTRKFAPGDYTIRVVAVDAEGNEGSASVTVTLVDTLGGGGRGGRASGQAADGSDSSADASAEAATLPGSGTGALSWWLLAMLLAPRLLRRRNA